MRIKHIYISQYKNLNKFALDFDGDSFIDVFVGKNGSGKSNFFEAFIEILRHLLEQDHEISFEYKIEYSIDGQDIYLEWKGDKFVDKGNKETKHPPSRLLPENILIYYSGHNKTVQGLISKYEKQFGESINKNRNKANIDLEYTRRFFGVGPDYKEILLCIMLLQDSNLKAKKFLSDKLGIEELGNEIRITFKRPDYAKGSNSSDYSFDEFDDEQRFWGAEGFVKTFLDQIWKVKRFDKAPPRKEGYFNDKEGERYILYRDLKSFQKEIKFETSLELFNAFDMLKTIGMLQYISIDLKLKSKQDFPISQFSDGQFQSVYIYAITELFKDKNSITLLDEPDSFLHPEWQFDFLKQVIDISSESSESNHVIMTSHSAITLLNSQEKKINFFDLRKNKISCYKVDKTHAIAQLSSKMIKVNQDKQILSIIHTIGQDKPILFTEGHSDPVILKEAWTQLYDEEIPFEICFGHGCLYLRLLLQDQKFLSEMDQFPIFGLFDFDLAYEQWNSLKIEDDELIESDPYKGLTKKVKGRNSYAMMIPVPKIKEIEKQVIKKNKSTFKGESKVELEHLFYNKETAEYFQTKQIVGGGQVIEISDSAKMRFATEVVPAIDKKYFEVFRPMFEFIKKKTEELNKPVKKSKKKVTVAEKG